MVVLKPKYFPEVGMGGRRLLMVLAGINALVLAAMFIHANQLAAASDRETIRARAIELVDQHGRVRAQLNVESNGEAVFRLRDAKGEIRVKLGAGEDGSGLLLLDGATEPAIHMRAKDGGTSVTLTGKGKQPRVIAP
jgi:hypothetical protein